MRGWKRHSEKEGEKMHLLNIQIDGLKIYQISESIILLFLKNQLFLECVLKPSLTSPFPYDIPPFCACSLEVGDV